MSQSLKIATLFVIFLAAISTSLRADMLNPFDPMLGYNVMAFGTYTQNGSGDTEGRLAVRNNMTTRNNYGVGQYISADPSKPSLVVGGQLSTTGAWKVFNGNAYYGSSMQTNPVSYDGGYGRTMTNPINFQSAYEKMSNSSQYLSTLSATANMTNSYGNSYINVGGGLQIVNINLDDMYHSGTASNFGYGLNITGQSDTTLILNFIAGEAYKDMVLSGGFQLNGIQASNLLINLIGVDTLTMNNMTISGNILGVDTDLILGNGNLEGYMAFANITTNSGGEFHNKFFFDKEFDIPPVNPVPEPATLLTFGLGLAGLALLRRRHAA